MRNTSKSTYKLYDFNTWMSHKHLHASKIVHFVNLFMCPYVDFFMHHAVSSQTLKSVYSKTSLHKLILIAH